MSLFTQLWQNRSRREWFLALAMVLALEGGYFLLPESTRQALEQAMHNMELTMHDLEETLAAAKGHP
jgi:uncharacterized protein YjeT (DUF2065 family)